MDTTWNEEKTAAPEVKIPAAPKKISRAMIVLPTLILLAGAGGGGMWLAGRGKESTDDAQLEGRIVNVSPRVAGQVKAVHVLDNQKVAKGDVLVELDDAPIAARVAATKADVAAAKAQLRAAQAQLAVTEKTADAGISQARGGVRQAASGVSSSRASIDQARADVVAAESRRSLAQTEMERVERLHADGAVSQAEYDNRKSQLEQANATLDQVRSRLTSAEENVHGSTGALEMAQGRLAQAQTAPEQVELAHAQVGVAEAKLAQAEAAARTAELDLSYTVVRAPSDGVISRRSVEEGQLVGPDRPLVAIVPIDDVWVVANFKEDQLAKMHAGQKVKVEVDALGGRKLDAHVDSLAGASGARFSLLPPDNASGNYIKVVQRVPTLIRFDDPAVPGELALKPGMSVVVTVYQE